MTTEELIQQYPRVFHMAEHGTWESIRHHGLLSTTALLDLFDVNGDQRSHIESMRRPECVSISHPVYGVAVIRDQKPMSDLALSKCLSGATPRQWYELLNRRTFFWLSIDRLNRLLKARAYRDRPHCIITVDTRGLLERHAARVTLSPINTGSTIMSAQPRSPATFSNIGEYPFDAWCRRRNKKNAIAELVVDYSVPDIAAIVLSVEHRKGDRFIERVWPVGNQN